MGSSPRPISKRATKARFLQQVAEQPWVEDYDIDRDDLLPVVTLLTHYAHRLDHLRLGGQDGTEIERLSRLNKAVENMQQIIDEITRHRGTRNVLRKVYSSGEMGLPPAADGPACLRAQPLLREIAQECGIANFLFAEPPRFFRGKPQNIDLDRLIRNLASRVRAVLERNKEPGVKILDRDIAGAVATLAALVGIKLSRKRIQNLLLSANPANCNLF